MTCAERRAVAFVHLIAEWHPEPGSPIGLAVTAARRLSVALHVEAGTHIAAPVLPPVAGTVRAASSFPPSLDAAHTIRSEEHTSELQSLMRISYAVFCLKKKTKHNKKATETQHKHTDIRTSDKRKKTS